MGVRHFEMLVVVTRTAQKQLRKVPRHIVRKFEGWVVLVTEEGIEAARKIPGYHDEPLVGDREGQRSIRLNRSYRAIYEECQDIAGEDDDEVVIEFVSVEEVINHDYQAKGQA